MDMMKYQSEIDIEDIHIDGVDAAIGCALYYDDVDMYFMILRSFVNNTPEVIDQIEEVSMDHMTDYQLRIHGIKSVCAMIGAEEIRARAYELELYAKDKNLEEILKRNPSFIQDIRDLVSRIQEWLAEIIED